MGAGLPVGAAVPSLVRWGLSSDADMVFRTIATFGSRSARTLRVELGLPARRVDAALAELRAAGAASCLPDDGRSDRSAVWVIRPPGDVIATLRSRRMRPARRLSAHHHYPVPGDLPGFRAAVPARPPATGGELGDGVRYLASRQAARQRLADLVAIERQEHLAINTEQAFDTASARAAAPLDRQIVERGVRLRVLGLPPADGDRHVGQGLLDRPRCGYREAPQVPMKLIVIDHRVALFPADPGDLDRGYLEVAQPGVVRALVMLFDHHWAKAVDPREYGMHPIALSEREQELIYLLAQGHTDVTAAAQLHLSPRSVTKIMRGLMDRLGVENRFQLGLALGAARAAHPPPAGPLPTTEG